MIPPRPASRFSLTPGRLARLTAALAALAALGWLLREPARVLVVQPISQVLWLGWVGLQSLPQALLWVVFVLGAALAAVRSLAGRAQADEPSPPPAARGAGWSQSSRLGFWRTGLGALRRSPFAAERMARELQGLALQILAEQARLAPAEARERLLNGTLEPFPPPEVAALFRPLVFAPPPPAARRWWARLSRRPIPTPPAPIAVERVVQWIEEETS